MSLNLHRPAMSLLATVAVLGLALFAAVAPAAPPRPIGEIERPKVMGIGGDELKFLPDKPQIIMALRIDTILESDAFKELKDKIPGFDKSMEEMEKEIGFKPTDLARMVIGGNLTDGSEPLVIVQCKKAFTADDLKKTKGFKEATAVKVGNFTMYEGETRPGKNSPQAFCVVDGKTIVVGESGLLRKVLERGREAEVSENVKAGLWKVDFVKPIGYVIDIGSLPKEIKQLAQLAPLPGLAAKLENVQAVAGDLTLGAESEISFAVVCKDKDTAEGLRKIVDGALETVKDGQNTPKEAQEILDSIKLKADDTTFSIKLKVKIASLSQLGK